MTHPITPGARGNVDVRALVQQNEQLKAFIGILVMRMGGDVTLKPLEIARALSEPALVTCDKLPGPLTSYRLQAKRL